VTVGLKVGYSVLISVVAIVAIVAIVFILQKPMSEKNLQVAPPPQGKLPQADLREAEPRAGSIIEGPLGMKFAFIPAGTFMMGSPESEAERESNEKQHRVTLTKGFYIQTTEVTQRQWRTMMGNNSSVFEYCADCPVEVVTWKDVRTFIQKLNRKEGTNRYKLPTEAEWEYAARAGSTTSFANGGISELECAYDSNLDAMGWYCGNSGVTYSKCLDLSKMGGPKCAGTHPVAKKQPNAWGLYDMHGNVWEWCRDWYGKYSGGSVINPPGPSSGSYRVFRGGSWNYEARSCQSAYRNWNRPDIRM